MPKTRSPKTSFTFFISISLDSTIVSPDHAGSDKKMIIPSSVTNSTKLLLPSRHP
jgi:hypothetical protein